MADKNKLKLWARLRRKRRIRKKVSGTLERPRLTVYRSLKHIYAQLVDDVSGRTLTSVSDFSKDIRDEVAKVRSQGKIAVSVVVGKEIARRALEMNIQKVTFDRNGYLYHGRVKAVAEGAREGGLEF
ncbi:50S ribosomal protein L18 [candidate division KSB1 bacterium]|nr:50S ribosomal protein L18 [bacterium]OQX59216.1 MAG: 50S ribosomal protein L18 [candidate division KSB1 bacterium 4484_219]RKY80102.1 MAG: 50S ribosomal protein L18 [candidate division KSB1 bacterium]HDI51257.1 50S ribosomal protein L18 [Bacteroidota bacterium]RKY81122.1 MAG: 50S ribosomal protein L18 [candidate division KSB1 bacterium]